MITKINSSIIAARGIIAILLLTSIVSCGSNPGVSPGGNPPPPKEVWRAHHPKCKGGEPPVVIKINATPDVLADPEDEVTLVCPGQKLSWAVDPGVDVTSFTVDFRNKGNAHGIKLLSTEVLQSAGTPASTSSTETVNSGLASGTHLHYGDFLYSIETVVVKDGKTEKYTIDPHVIPVGN